MKLSYIPLVVLLMICNLSKAQNITVGNGQTLTITTNTTYTTLTVNNGGILIVQAPATLTVGTVGNAATTQVVDFQNGSTVNVNAGAFMVVYGKVNNSNNSDQVTIDGDLYINGNYNGGGGSEIIGSGTVNSSGSMTTSDGGNPGLIFGSGSDCSAGPCSGNNLSCSMANTISTANQSICAGSSASTWDGSTLASTTYQWQSSATGSSFTNISGATNEDYSPGIVSTTTYYRRSATKSGCTTYSPQRVVITTATVTPSVSISSSATTICAGASITITATPSNGGTPTYKWKKGGVAISGATNSTYTTTTAVNNDSYTVTMTSTATCPSPASVTSSAIVITVNSVTPSVSASSSATTICAGTSITLTAAPTNGGTPTYQWNKGGVAISGATNSTYTTTTAANNDSYTVTMTSTATCASPTTATSSAVVITVNPVLTPSVSASSSATTICAGTSITLTAAPTNGGTPTYQWKKGGVAISGATNATYTTTTAANNDSYTVTMTSTATCASPTTATSSAVVITVNPVLTPGVSASSSATTICAGTSITLTAAPTNGGTPTYQWKKGGVAISGATNSTHTTTTAANNDSYTVTMTSTATCASPTTATSSAVVITVNPVLTPSVSASSSATTICAGTSITLTAAPTNGGTPTYQWNKGGVAISGATNATYTTSTAANNDSYTVTMTSTATCASPTTATSSAVVITVNPVLTPGVSASSSATTICAGTSITLTAAPTNGGTPTYQWNKGGVAISGATNSTYTTLTAANNDSYTVTMTSTATCASPTTATSSAVVITVNPVLTPGVSASSSATTICAGTSITLTAAPTNGGTPTYQWKKGGVAISGATNATYTTTTAANNDSYTVTMTSTATCASPTTATSSAVVITVNNIPTITNVVPAARCGTGAITLSATPSAGSVVWYTVSANGISVYTGNNYTIPSLSSTTTYYVEATSNGCTSTSRVSVDATINTCAVSWIGVTSTDWNTSSNWSYGYIPSASDTVIIPSGVTYYPVLTTNTPVYKLRINSGASVSIASTGTLTMYSDLINNGTLSTVAGSTVAFKGNLAQSIQGVPVLYNVVIDNNAGVALQSALTVNGTVSLTNGALTTNSNLTVNFDNGGNIGYAPSDLGSIAGVVTGRRDLVAAKTHYMGAPFSGVTSGQVAATTPLYVNPYWKLFTRTFSTQTWAAVTSSTAAMPLGTGYSLSLPSAAPLVFTGTYDHTFALTGPVYPNTATGKFLLVANPYPSTIDWDNASGWTKTNVGNAIYYWDAPNNRAASYAAGIGTNGATGYIPPMQAVLVALTGSGGSSSVSINNNARISTQNPAYFRTAAADAVIRIRVEGSEGIQNDETIVRFNEHATNNFDPEMDAAKLLNGDSVPSIYTTSDTDMYSINSYASPDAAPYIPVAVKLPADGKYTLTVSNDNPDIEYILLDKKLGIEQTIKEAYSFTGEQTDDEDRFELQLRTGTGVQGTNSTSGLAINSATGAGFYVQTQRYAGLEAEIEIMDVTGNRIDVMAGKNLSAGSTFIPLDLQSGTYLVKVHVGTETFAGMIVLVK
ncbi:MAG: beta strand repeat-containing protein [Cytophaga sp.]|uniref:beta strand repeat-containing protein n=1 Tax=Cytophaga sp. TaxID=29535 RepID=UPI003F7F5E95